MTHQRRYLKTAGCTALLLLAAFWVGTLTGPETTTRADTRPAPPKQAFLSGSERSLPILQEISTTLKQIDDRLARIEKIAVAADQAQRAGGSP